MKPQDINTIVRLLHEEASKVSTKNYARIMMREAAHVITTLASELAARDEQISQHHLTISVQQMKASTAAARDRREYAGERVNVLERIAKYAREDGATTPRKSRLARALSDLSRIEAEAP